MQDRNLEQRFSEAFDAYADELFRHAFYRLSDREKAVDALQETYLRAWASAKKGADILDMRAFLYRTMRNIIIDEYRRKKASSLDALVDEETGAEALLDSGEDALEDAASRLDGARALTLVSELPDSYAEVILLRYADGLSVGEIADRIGTSENLVSVRIHRALRALKELFDSDTTP